MRIINTHINITPNGTLKDKQQNNILLNSNCSSDDAMDKMIYKNLENENRKIKGFTK